MTDEMMKMKAEVTAAFCALKGKLIEARVMGLHFDVDHESLMDGCITHISVDDWFDPFGHWRDRDLTKEKAE